MARDDVDLVIEVIGGIEPARSLILSALRHGASVVTANKALLAEDGATLFAAAEESSSDLYFEAAVAGAIPIIRPLRESLVGDEITAVIGIVNGTTNFILDKMDTRRGRLRRDPGRGPGAGLRRGRPDGRRRGLRRRRQGGDPGQPGLPHPGHRGRRVPRGHHRGDLLRHRLGRRDRLRGQAAGHLPAAAARPTERSERPRVGAGAPGDDPAQPPAGRGRRRVQRRVRGVDARPAG